MSGLFKALVLSPSELRGGGGAHAFRESHTHAHTCIVEAATFSQPALQTDSGKRSLGRARKGGRERRLEPTDIHIQERTLQWICSVLLLSGSCGRNLPCTFAELNLLLCTLLWQPRWDMRKLPATHLTPLTVGLSSSGHFGPFQAKLGALTWILPTHCTSWEMVAPFLVSL